MHYYKKNIGDYYKKAGRLTMLQHGAYTMLIDACYDREKFPTLDDAIDWCWASSKEEIEAVEFVLKKFFDVNGDRYEQNRIKEEVDKYHQNASINKRIALEREANKRKKSTKRERDVDEAPPNQEPITNNHKPITKDKDLSPENLKVLMADDFRLNDTNMKWLDESNLTGFEKSEVIKDFIDYWVIDGTKRSDKGWQQSFRKNPVVKRKITNSKHRGQNNESHKQSNKPSLAERATNSRKQFEQQDAGKLVGKNDPYLRP